MKVHVNLERECGRRSPMLYGHFIEHFHRQIYGGVFDPKSPFADEDGFRLDVLDAMRKIKVPVLRWPGGCFVSSYHWKDAVGSRRSPFFDKAWRVEDPNMFGTDEYIKLCRKIGCEPYICTNAGTGTPEEMSDWVEYCNLENEGKYAKWRVENGYKQPHGVKYWSIGNENYGTWEIGAKKADEWGRLVKESAKMIKHVDPTAELSAAALADVRWNVELLENCGEFLDWISIHQYWDPLFEKNEPANYEQTMALTSDLGRPIKAVRGLLTAMGLEGKIKIAYDEWNLRGWHHPNTHTIKQGITKEEYLSPRDKNDDNSQYTMADAVFTACVLNELNRNCDVVGMANFAPIVNTRGCIYTYPEGIVLRSTYYVFDLFVNYLGDIVLDSWSEDIPRMKVVSKFGELQEVDVLDTVVTKRKDCPGIVVSAINKDANNEQQIMIDYPCNGKKITLFTLTGAGTESYNDVGREEVGITKSQLAGNQDGISVILKPHSVNIIQIV